jgi:hypothetical protein
MLDWHQGQFALDPPDSRKFDSPVDASAQEILMEGIRQQDEFNALRSRLPALDSALRLNLPLEPKLSELNPVQLDVLQAVLNSSSLDVVFDSVPSTDLEAGQAILHLMQRGYLVSAD